MTIQPARIMGHRGAPSLAPENTLGGFRAAAAAGARWVELDVTLLGDMTPVVHHDATLTRCSDRRGPLTKLTREDLAQINCAARFPDWPAEPLPTLTQVLALLQQLEMGLNLEIKPHRHRPDQIAQAIIDNLTDQFPLERLLLSSFDTEVLAECMRRAPHIPRGLICDDLPDNWLTLARELNLFSIHCNWKHLTQPQAAAIKAAGYRLYCWTANDPAAVASLWHWGIDGIMTDYPQNFISAPDTESAP